MERWYNKIAVVTGASAGIGATVAKDLAKEGFVVVGLARRVERVEALRNELPEDAKFRLNALKCDVTNEKEVLNTFAIIEEKFGGVDVLVNNAGIVRSGQLVAENNTEDLKNVLDTNVMALAYCTREAFKSMKKRGVKNGHVVVINSLLGHYIPQVDNVFFNIYAASKHAVTAMVTTYRREFLAHGTQIKITDISPGAVETEIFPAEFFKQFACLQSEDISDAVLYVIKTPPSVQIQQLIITPMGAQY